MADRAQNIVLNPPAYPPRAKFADQRSCLFLARKLILDCRHHPIVTTRALLAAFPCKGKGLMCEILRFHAKPKLAPLPEPAVDQVRLLSAPF